MALRRGAHDEWTIAERRYLSEGSMASILTAGEPGDLASTAPALLAPWPMPMITSTR